MNLFLKRLDELRSKNGKSFEEFSAQILSSLKSILISSTFCFFCITFIILLSIFLRYQLDIGADSATYLDIAQRLVEGQSYYYGFLDSNTPLNFFIFALPVFISKITHLHVIATAQIFVDLLGIFSLFCCFRILQKTKISEDKILFNLLLILFAMAYFWRSYTIEFNEFLTKSSLFIAFALPYFCYYLPRKDEAPLLREEKFIIGILMALIIGLKPQYALLPIMLEINRALAKKSIAALFRIETYFGLLVFLIYLAYIFLLVPEYIEYAIPITWGAYAKPGEILDWVRRFGYLFFNEKLFLVTLFVTLVLIRSFKNIDKVFLSFLLGAVAIFFSEVVATYDQSSILNGVFLIVTTKILYDLIKLKLFKESKIKGLIWILFPLGIANFFDNKIYDTIVHSSFAWYLASSLVLISLFTDHKIVKLLKNLNKIYYILLSVLLVSWVIIFDALSFSCLIFFFLILFKEISRIKTSPYKNYFSNSATLVLFITVLCFFNFTYSSLVSAYKRDHWLKTPNALSDSMYQYVNKYAPSENILVIAIWYFSQITKYADVQPYDFVARSTILNEVKNIKISKEFDKINPAKQKLNDYVFDKMMEIMIDKKAKLIFVSNKDEVTDNKHKSGRCFINLIEYYLSSNPEFKRYFLKNYRFLNRIIIKDKAEGNIRFLNYKERKDPLNYIAADQSYLFDFDVYIRH